MIDLSISNRYYEIKMPKGEVIHIKRPNQELLVRMMKLKDISTDDWETVFGSTLDLIIEVFNRNTEGNIYQKSDIEDYVSFKTAMAIIQDYLEFALEEIKK